MNFLFIRQLTNKHDVCSKAGKLRKATAGWAQDRTWPSLNRKQVHCTSKGEGYP